MSATQATVVRTPQDRASRIAFRRGLTLLFMTLFLPGSAQLAVGGRGVGKFALRVWGVVVALLAGFVLLFVVRRNWAIGLYANAWVQWTLAVFFLAAGLGWALLLLDAWRLSQPKIMGSPRRWWMSLVSLVLVFAVGFGGFQASAASRSQAMLFGSVFAGGGVTKAHKGRINVLLIGADADSSREGIRTDTIMLASISAKTGRTVLFSLPRNLQGVKFPASSPLRQMYPEGYRCKDESCLLNAVYQLGEENADKFTGIEDPGLQALKDAVSETLGLPINYYAMIDLRGFEKLIDAVGGIRLDIARPVPIGGGTTRVSGYIQPGKNVHLDGRNALWFARSRHKSSDYERMARQKCVINAMVKQLNPVTVLTNFNQLASASKQIVRTDVPSSELGVLTELAEKGRHLPLASISFAPPLIKPAWPDFNQIQALVVEAIKKSEQLDREARAAGTPSPSSEPTASAEPKKPKKAVVAKTAPKVTTEVDQTRQTDDLSDICGVSS